jgi:adenylate cyclase
MAQELKRKLTAILSADVKGYSRLMGEDEEWTVRTLDTFKGVMKTVIPQHRGRVVDSTGDNLLAEFASVVDAVQAAVEIQQVLKAKNSLLPENRRMEFRIGINLGDVIEEGERIFGDGVNIAARLAGYASRAVPSSRSRTSCRCTMITWASTRLITSPDLCGSTGH